MRPSADTYSKNCAAEWIVQHCEIATLRRMILNSLTSIHRNAARARQQL